MPIAQGMAFFRSGIAIGILSSQSNLRPSSAFVGAGQRGDAKLEDESRNAYLNLANPKDIITHRSNRNYSSKQFSVVSCSNHSTRATRSDAKIDSRLSARKDSSGETIRTLILDNYDSYTYNLYQLLSVINGIEPVVLRNDEITWEYLCHLLYKERAFHNVVISPGPGSPTCASDIGLCLQLLRECSDIPILGVCLGHQALGFVHGADILHAPEPVHGRLSEIEHNGHLLFSGIPSGRSSGFKVVRYHSLMVDASTLPEDLVPTAWTITTSESAFCGKPDSKVLMGLSHRIWPHHGVQFHPESVATAYGKQILENFRSLTEEFWKNQPWQPHKLTNELLVINAQEPLMNELCAAALRDYGQANQQVQSSRGICYDLGLGHLSKAWSNAAKQSSSGVGTQIKNEGEEVETLRLFSEKLPGFAAKAGGTKNLFCNLFGTEAVEDTFWLDSSTLDQGRARFSFMGGKGGSLWHRMTYRIGCQGIDGKLNGVLRVEDATGHVKETVLQDGFLNFLNKELEQRRCKLEDYASLPFDFCGGFIGYLGYELKVECGAESNRHKSPMPDAGMFLADHVVVVDHSNDDVYVLALYQDTYVTRSHESLGEVSRMTCQSTSLSEESVQVSGAEDGEECSSRLTGFLKIHKIQGNVGQEGNMRDTVSESPLGYGQREAQSWVEGIVRKIYRLGQKIHHEGIEKMHHLRLVSSVHTTEDGLNPAFVADKSRTAYIADVERCQDLIKDGESYEVCLTTQLRKKVPAMDSFSLYLTLRETNPAPYSAWMHFGKYGPSICSSSPERFLRLDRSGVLEAKPIKGTVARGNTPVEDEILKHQLSYSEKDQAENLMIVDLLRNDLGRVCKPGSVHVPSLMAVESYSTVHTLVSTVRGERRPDMTPIDCVKAAFPGGSMTGAPKLRTMEIIDSLETSPRGVYSGSLGFFSFNSSFDLNIVIRTLIFNEGEVTLGAGGAVIALSDPEGEYEEMILKAKAPIRAITKCENLVNSSEQRGSIFPLGL